MKIYHVETQEDYDALMVELEKKDAKWVSGEKATDIEVWYVRKKLTCILLEDNIIDYDRVDFCKKDYPNIPIQTYKAHPIENHDGVDVNRSDNMKIYHVGTQEDYDALMTELEGKGVLWNSGLKPTSSNHWIDRKEDTTVHLEDNKVITCASLGIVAEVYPNTPIQKYKAHPIENHDGMDVNRSDNMKIYHTETQEDYYALMIELEDQGILWYNGKEPTSRNNWRDRKEDTAVYLEDNKVITHASLSLAEDVYPNTPIQTYKAKWGYKAEAYVSMPKKETLNQTISERKNNMYEKKENDIPNKLVEMMEEHIELGLSLLSFLKEATRELTS